MGKKKRLSTKEQCHWYICKILLSTPELYFQSDFWVPGGCLSSSRRREMSACPGTGWIRKAAVHLWACCLCTQTHRSSLSTPWCTSWTHSSLIPWCHHVHSSHCVNIHHVHFTALIHPSSSLRSVLPVSHALGECPVLSLPLALAVPCLSSPSGLHSQDEWREACCRRLGSYGTAHSSLTCFVFSPTMESSPGASQSNLTSISNLNRWDHGLQFHQSETWLLGGARPIWPGARWHIAFAATASILEMRTVNKEGESQKILAPMISIPSNQNWLVHSVLTSGHRMCQGTRHSYINFQVKSADIYGLRCPFKQGRPFLMLLVNVSPGDDLCTHKKLFFPHALYFLENLALWIPNCFFKIERCARLNLNVTTQKLQNAFTRISCSGGLIIIIDNSTELGGCICD